MLVLLLASVAAGGCTDRKKGSDETASGDDEKSNARILLEGVTGKSAVERGRKARKTITTISRDRDKELDKIAGTNGP